MRHLNRTRILGRKSQQRKALLHNLATSILLHEKIVTTEAKAKTVKSLVEKLITIGKKNDLTARRKLLSILHTKKAVSKTLDIISPKYKDRNGGYTRITHLSPRQGDGAHMVRIELV